MDVIIVAQEDADFRIGPQAVDQSCFFTDAVDDFFIFIMLERRIFVIDVDIHGYSPNQWSCL